MVRWTCHKRAMWEFEEKCHDGKEESIDFATPEAHGTRMLVTLIGNKPGTAQVGAISKAQKQQKDFQVFSSTVPEKPKSWTELAHQRRHWNFSSILSQIIKKIEGGALLVKKILSKKSHNAEKTKRGTLWDFSTSVLSKNSKKLKGGPFGKIFFRKKVSQSRKYSKCFWSLWVS